MVVAVTSRKYGSRIVELSNQSKVLFPEDGITKGDLIAYYDLIADRMLPHLKGRPLVVQRYPDGIGSQGFFQKQVGAHFPSWIKTARVRKEGGWQTLAVCDDRATLVYLANQAAIVMHPWQSRTASIDCPDLFVLDLDPPTEDFAAVRRAARSCRRLFDELEVAVFLKTSGSKGLHLVVPLSGKENYEVVRDVARRIAGVLEQRHPEELTTQQRKDKRGGRVFLDVGRTAYAQTAVAPYSVRAVRGAPVSAPIAWEELASRRLSARTWTIRNVLEHEDPWTDFARRRTSMAAISKRLELIAPRAAATHTAKRSRA